MHTISFLKGSYIDPSISNRSSDLNALANYNVVVEEMIDGIAATISFSKNAEPIFTPASLSKDLSKWLEKSINKIFDLIHDRYVLHGVFCKNKNIIFYDHVCDYFIETDFFDKQNNQFLSTSQRQSLIAKLASDAICSSPIIKIGKLESKSEIETLCALPSFYKTADWKNVLLKQCVDKNINYYKVAAQLEDSMLMKGISIKAEDNIKVVSQYLYIRPNYANILPKINERFNILNVKQ